MLQVFLLDILHCKISSTRMSFFPAFGEKDIFAMPSRSKIENTAMELLNELFGVTEDEEVEVFEEVNEVPTVKTFAQNLQEKIEMKTTPKPLDISPSNTKILLKSEMALFEATQGQQRGELLTKLFLALKNIAPTSIASEQAFSVSASFISKIRSLLSDQAIDDLMFEKGYFANEGYFYN